MSNSQTYQPARVNMVKSQLATNHLHDARIARALLEVPREEFVPTALKGVAYIDEDLEFAPGRYLMEPMVFARMLEMLEPSEFDRALTVGAGEGYGAAVLSRLVSRVVALESDARITAKASDRLAFAYARNAHAATNPLREGYPMEAPYDVIILEGAVEEVPQALLNQLAEGGRLAAVVRKPGCPGQAWLYTHIQGRIAARPVFDASIPFLPGFEKPGGFSF